MESSIQILSDHVANKIAAGEVVERPASVFKELVENAIDAGATQIEVEIVVGGRKALIVSDNGKGMNRDEALLCIERHATSKIRDVDDIEAISTLGFRGEAVPAIASVSRFQLITRATGAESGTEVVISGGKLQDVGEAGCPEGTRIAVRNLFFNVPARRKFLRTEQTETAHIKHMFLVYSLAHPMVGFRLVADEREVYNLPAGLRFEDRLYDLYNKQFVESLVPTDVTLEGVRVHGWVGRPSTHRRDRSEQFVFVNARPSTAPLIANGISEAYRNTLPKGRQPIVFLFIECDARMVDVNVHPTKREVRFRNGVVVRDTVIRAIGDALTQAGSVPVTSTEGALPTPFAHPDTPPETLGFSSGHVAPTTPDLPYPAVAPHAEGTTTGAPLARPQSASGPLVEAQAADHAPWKSCRIIDRVGIYVLLEMDDGLVIMDPQAAHERVLFERLMAEVAAQKVQTQGLLQPETVALPSRDAARVRNHLGALQLLGFGVAEFGGDTFIVDGVPLCLGRVSVSSILGELAESFETLGDKSPGEELVADRLARVACRSSVTSRQRLSPPELKALVDDLGKCSMPYTCPHGRPTLIFMGFRELDRKFGRS